MRVLLFSLILVFSASFVQAKKSAEYSLNIKLSINGIPLKSIYTKIADGTKKEFFQKLKDGEAKISVVSQNMNNDSVRLLFEVQELNNGIILAKENVQMVSMLGQSAELKIEPKLKRKLASKSIDEMVLKVVADKWKD